MDTETTSSSLRFSVDEAVTDFMLWLDAKQDERKIGKVGKQPGKNETWVPKYDTMDAILAEYGDGRDAADSTPAGILGDIGTAEIAEVLARIDAESEPEF